MSNTLLVNLAAHWKMNETSGTRVDSHTNSLDLTDNNTVGFTTGKIGNAADFEYGNSEYLSLADNALVSPGDAAWTMAAWVKLESKPANATILGRWTGSGDNREYILFYRNGSVRFVFAVSDDGTGTAAEVEADELGAVSLATLYLVVAWHDPNSNTVNIQVNDGAIDSTAHTGGIAEKTSIFTVGATSITWDGEIDSLSLWDAVLTPADKTALYNSGSGLDYESFGTAVDSTFTAPSFTDVSYAIWLTDVSGQRLRLLDRFLGLSYRRSVNAVGVCQIQLPFDFDIGIIEPDQRIEVWRTVGGRRYLDTETCYFIRYINTMVDENGLKQHQIRGVSALELLGRRVVAYSAGESEAEKTDLADDMIKEIVAENLGGSATDTDRDISSFLSIDADDGDGVSIAKGFSYRKVLLVCQELAQASTQAGTPLFFDVIYDKGTLKLRTYINQRGQDLSGAGARFILSVRNHTISAGNQGTDYGEEITVSYTGGQGEGTLRTFIEVEDTDRAELSALNRREGYRDARHLSLTSSLTDEGEAFLRAGRPVDLFNVQVRGSNSVQYGREWNFGDKIDVSFEGVRRTCRVDGVQVSISNKVEQIRADLRVVE